MPASGGAARVSKHCQGQSDLFFAGCGLANNLMSIDLMFLTKSIGMQDSIGSFFRKDRTSRLRAFRIHLLIVLYARLYFCLQRGFTAQPSSDPNGHTVLKSNTGASGDVVCRHSHLHVPVRPCNRVVSICARDVGYPVV